MCGYGTNLIPISSVNKSIRIWCKFLIYWCRVPYSVYKSSSHNLYSFPLFCKPRCIKKLFLTLFHSPFQALFPIDNIGMLKDKQQVKLHGNNNSINVTVRNWIRARVKSLSILIDVVLFFACINRQNIWYLYINKFRFATVQYGNIIVELIEVPWQCALHRPRINIVKSINDNEMICNLKRSMTPK